jgi:DNA-binding PucR family transcriptional regulator
MANTERVKEAVARAGLDAVLLMDDRDIYYATGFLPTDSAALVGAEGAWLVTDSRYIEAAQKQAAPGVEALLTTRERPLGAILRELADRYKEAQVAIEVGKVFDTEKSIINYENLGIGRIIYQLPTTLCEMFLSEVFKKNPIEALDPDTLETINKFFENNLNVSETSRKLYVHRNTLVYRLEKIKKITGLDLREFDHAIVFKVAMMVKKYLDTQNTSKY